MHLPLARTARSPQNRYAGFPAQSSFLGLSRRLGADLGLYQEHAFVFVYPFDVNSHLARKNPLGLVRAFRLAFPPADVHVALLLRVNGNPDCHPGWAAVTTECAADRRITILAGTLDRQAALGVVAASDCLVSPHRAEGFGRNIAEAILLGIPVLATAFSGCTDFLAPEEGLPFVLYAGYARESIRLARDFGGPSRP